MSEEEILDSRNIGGLTDLGLTPEMLNDEQYEDMGEETEMTNRIQNLMEVEQFVYVEGRKWILAPYQTAALPDKIADAFLRERGQFVRRYERTPGYVEQGQPIVWLANMTGNPYAPETIFRMVVRKGREEREEIQNPIKLARYLRWEQRTGQKYVQVDTGDGMETKAINFPPRVFELAPFERKPFASIYAERALEADGFRLEEDRGQIVQCRAPTPGEPNETWSYKELRLYAELMSKSTFAEYFKGTKANPARFPPDVKGELEEQELKNDIYQFLFFRLIDPRFPLVPVDVFEEEATARGLGGRKPE